MGNIIVADIMTRDPITIKPDANLLDCAKTMVKNKVGSILIVDKKRLVGFIAQEDILWAIVKKSKEDLSKIRAVDISPRKIATIKPTAPIDELLKKMKKLKFERLPVIHEGQLVGMVTSKDVLTFNPQAYPEFDEIEKIREEANKLNRLKSARSRDSIYEGICEECGTQDILSRVNGSLICQSCKELI